MSKSDIIFAKLDSGFFSNHKVIRAGRDGRDVYLHVLCMNAARGGKGFIPASEIAPWYLRRQLDMTEQQAVTGVTRAIEAELIRIEGEFVLIDGWDVDWSRRAATGAERTEKWRKTKSGDETKVTRDGAVTCDGSEERRGEREEASHSLSGSAGRSTGSHADKSGSDAESPKAATRAARGANQQALAPAWKPTKAAASLAHSKGLDVAQEAEKFRANAKSHGLTAADWDAKFEKWLLSDDGRGVGKKQKRAEGATTRTPRPIRIRLEDGTYVEDDGDGGMRVITDGVPKP